MGETMSNLKYALLVIAGLVFLLPQQCSSPDTIVNGSSSETVIGKVYNNDGTPACSTIVKLFPDNYDPVADNKFYTSISDTTDAAGTYFLKLPDDSSCYFITAIRMFTGNSALITNVHATDDTTIAADAVLKNPGSITVTIVPDSVFNNGYLFIPGTRLFVTFTGGTSSITLDSVPAGIIPEITILFNDDTSLSIRKFSVAVEPERTTTINYPQWRYSGRLYLNTSPGGADVAGMVTGFPALVRLRSDKFDFNEAKSDGTDIRFTSSSGAPLQFEIERWDSGIKEAEVWVRVDTIRGNNDSQYITMYWGNAGASDKSNSIATFDTSAGFQGVWHLNEKNGSEIAYDATANRYYGTPHNMTTASVVKGAVGMARSFSGDSNYIVMQNTEESQLNFPENGVYSMSLWVYADTIDTVFHAIAGKGHEQYYMQLKGLKNKQGTWEFVEFHEKSGWEYTEDSIPPAPGAHQWIFLTGVRSGMAQKLYINGVVVSDSASLMKSTAGRKTDDNFFIGSFGQNVTLPYPQGWSYFKGKIDEVRVSNKVPGDNWVRLCYMNQKADDALVVFAENPE
jgi:hypothetical protein